MDIYEIVTPTFIRIWGIVTYGLLLLTLVGGLLRRQLAPVFKKAYLPIHRTGGILALALATIHGAIVIIFW